MSYLLTVWLDETRETEQWFATLREAKRKSEIFERNGRTVRIEYQDRRNAMIRVYPDCSPFYRVPRGWRYAGGETDNDH